MVSPPAEKLPALHSRPSVSSGIGCIEFSSELLLIRDSLEATPSNQGKMILAFLNSCNTLGVNVTT
jgi:hypothetical protein